MGFAESLPFVGITSLGWVLLKGYDAESLGVTAARWRGQNPEATSIPELGFSIARTSPASHAARKQDGHR